MKKSTKSKNSSGTAKTRSDVNGFMANIQQQLAALAKKVDALLGRAPAEGTKAEPAPRSAGSPASSGGGRSPRGKSGRSMHQAVCADCHKNCEIPFKPTGERPVYCKECFAKLKAARRAAPAADHQAHPSEQKPDSNSTVQSSAGRRVTVTKKGVGRVTISEVDRPSAGTPNVYPKHRPHTNPGRDLPGKKKK